MCGNCNELNKNFFASHAFVCTSVSNEMKDVGVVLLEKCQLINLVLKELYFSSVLHCWR